MGSSVRELDSNEDCGVLHCQVEYFAACIIHWKTYDHGVHFAAHKVPDVYVSDVGEFFRTIGG
jgi:hypothetical protein